MIYKLLSNFQALQPEQLPRPPCRACWIWLPWFGTRTRACKLNFLRVVYGCTFIIFWYRQPISVVIYFLSAGPAITTHLALSALPPPLTPSLRRGCPVAGPYQLFWSAPAPGPRLESQTYYITSRYSIVSWIFVIATNDLMVALCVIKCSLRIILRHCSIFHPHPFFVGHNLRCWF